MTKTPATKNAVTEKNAPDTDEVVEPTAEELREQELSIEEALADLPELYPPHMLRLRDKNRVTEIMNRMRKTGLTRKLGKPGVEVMLEMGSLLADVDDFAESIAFDKDEYRAWAQENSENYDAFTAILMRYSEALGK